jgi:hypothetical protein
MQPLKRPGDKISPGLFLYPFAAFQSDAVRVLFAAASNAASARTATALMIVSPGVV